MNICLYRFNTVVSSRNVLSFIGGPGLPYAVLNESRFFLDPVTINDSNHIFSTHVSTSALNLHQQKTREAYCMTNCLGSG